MKRENEEQLMGRTEKGVQVVSAAYVNVPFFAAKRKEHQHYREVSPVLLPVD